VKTKNPIGWLASSLLLMLSVTHATGAESAGPYYATPSWNQQLPAATRFIVLTNWASAAVLDRETGLVWEKAPNNTLLATLGNAHGHCLRSSVGGRKGWRLPSVQELSSLVDPTQASPAMPAGHPFAVEHRQAYWTSTMADLPGPPAEAWGVIFTSGNVGHDSVFNNYLAWCVRGGSGVEVQGH
jgi:hypothetical protein